MDWESASRKAPTYTEQHRIEKHWHTYMPRQGFEQTIPMFERFKAIRVLYGATTETVYKKFKYGKSVVVSKC